MKKPVIYLAGKMSGLPDYGRGQFYKAEAVLRAQGNTVLNPACLPTDLPDTAYIPICLAMLDQCDIVLMLPGWEDSEGAKIEHIQALLSGKNILYWDEEEIPL